MKYLTTHKGIKILVDDINYEKVSMFKWQISPTGYVYRTDKRKTLGTSAMYLSRYLMNPPKDKYVDHIDGDKLNNQKSNLRICTPAESICNRRLGKNNLSGYKGVSRFRDRWQAHIWKGDKHLYLGLFDYPKEAALKYNQMAKKLHKEFAYLNK